jgi:hypothetical protein
MLLYNIVGYKVVDWIYLAYDWDLWLTAENPVANLQET